MSILVKNSPLEDKKEILDTMLSNYPDLQIKEESIMKSQSSEYTIHANNRFVGRIEEMNTSLELKNQLLKLINLHAVMSKHFYVANANGEVIAQLKKSRGFSRDIEVHGPDGRVVAVLKQKLGMKNQMISAQSPAGKSFLKAVGECQSYHFTITDEMTKEVVATIQKKSLRSATLKESLFSEGYYQLHHTKPPERSEQIILIAMTVVVNDQLHRA